MVAFSVYKSSKYVFDCVAATGAEQVQPYPTVDLDALEALRLDAVDVVKRMDYAEVDKLVACCRQHPPQTLVVPATHGDKVPFQDFTKYLKVRQRAGVVMLADGRLLVLAPLENNDLRLRCVVVKTKPTPGISASLPSHVTTRIRVDETAHVRYTAPESQEALSVLPPPAVEQSGGKQRRGRVRSRKRNRTQQEEISSTVNEGSSSEPKQNSQATTPGTESAEELAMLYSLPRIERATYIAQLRQEYETFNALHYDILRDWSKSDPAS
ncbi:hypothetical protein PRIC1_003736 [Phytophthora ramorum]